MKPRCTFPECKSDSEYFYAIFINDSFRCTEHRRRDNFFLETPIDEFLAEEVINS